MSRKHIKISEHLLIIICFIFTVDNAHPEITCARDISPVVNCGTTSVQVDFPATATDDCNDVSITYTSSGATSFYSRTSSVSSMNIGTSIVTATATDGSGKTSTCETHITIIQGN